MLFYQIIMPETINIQTDARCHVHVKGQVCDGSRNMGQNDGIADGRVF